MEVIKGLNSSVFTREPPNPLDKPDFNEVFSSQMHINYAPLKNLFNNPIERKINSDTIIKCVVKITGISIEKIKSNKRDKVSTMARRITMYLLREDAHMTSTAVAQMLGGKDHSTVIYAQKAIEKQIQKDLILREKIIEIRELINVSV